MTTPQPRPKTVEVAFWLSVVAVVIALTTLGVVLSAIHLGSSLVDAANDAPPGGFLKAFADAFGGSMLFAAVVNGVVAALALTVVGMMRGGKNWARAVVTVLCVGGLGWLMTSRHGVDLSSPSAFALITIATIVAVPVLLYAPASNRYFARPRA
ncbi:hypothetical protein [Allokutzneria sp. NRRL B-24872]|uniref:hypothetical protein n=1 Tax=Allokutzneria sp. NRRL B-24872 TaxID=1137961 RepID=UPI000A3C38C5|nr:hypothetical protein [Allokutzneria sp. NRRL B-24872]